jgi:hypothetical protein
VGSGLRKLFALVVVLLIAHAGWRVGPTVVTFIKLRDHVGELARYSGAQSAEELQKAVDSAAQKVGVTFDPGTLKVQKVGQRVMVDARYRRQLEILPRYFYPYEFTIAVDTVITNPIPLDQIR